MRLPKSRKTSEVFAVEGCGQTEVFSKHNASPLLADFAGYNGYTDFEGCYVAITRYKDSSSEK